MWQSSVLKLLYLSSTTLISTHKIRKQVSWLINENSLYMVYHNNNAHVFSLNLSKAKQQFDNLKNRFSNQEGKSKKATRSGWGSCEAKQAETKLKKENDFWVGLLRT